MSQKLLVQSTEQHDRLVSQHCDNVLPGNIKIWITYFIVKNDIVYTHALTKYYIRVENSNTKNIFVRQTPWFGFENKNSVDEGAGLPKWRGPEQLPLPPAPRLLYHRHVHKYIRTDSISYLSKEHGRYYVKCIDCLNGFSYSLGKVRLFNRITEYFRCFFSADRIVLKMRYFEMR